jgi:hypothetical protein
MPKDQKISTTKHGKGISRIKPIKDIGDGVQTQLIKNPDKSTITQRYKDGKLVASDYNPKKMKVKKTKKLKTTRVPRKLKKVKVPAYTAPAVTLDEDDLKEVAKRERIANAKKKKKKLKIKLPKIKLKKGRKRRKVKNLVTGKYNYTQ